MAGHVKKRIRRRRIAGIMLVVTLTIAGLFFAIRWLSPLSAKSTGDMVYASYTVIPKRVIKAPLVRPDVPEITREPETNPDAARPWETMTEHGTPDTDKLDSQFGGQVPEGDAVDDSYFSDAVFIGNSRTEGFALYSGLPNIRAYTARGASVSTVFTDPVMNQNGKKVSIMDAVKNSPAFSKAYIMLGTNELGWVYGDLFIEKYGEIIDTLREINPNVTIYVQSILPVTKEKSDGDRIYNNAKIREFNALLQEMCEEKAVYFVNTAEAVSDESGVLPADSSFDGVHLNRESCQKWLEYLKTHTVGDDKL